MVADIALTYHGIERGLVEGILIARFALEWVGCAALGAFKLLALGVGLAGRAALPAEYTAIVPLGLAAPGRSPR